MPYAKLARKILTGLMVEAGTDACMVMGAPVLDTLLRALLGRLDGGCKQENKAQSK